MKVLGWIPILLLLGAAAGAESLGDVAKRERERPEKKKQEGADAKVVHEEELAAPSSRDAKGTMEDAEEAARQGWLSPGDVRAMRQRYGMDDSFWDKLADVVHRFRR
jgi:hypothetical protein